MATPVQIEANRQNAKSSTGPRTPEGKQASAQNGITTGLFTARDFIRDEEREEYTAFAAQYRLELAPTGIIENTLATEILSAAWRLRRCLIAEAAPEVTEAQQKSIERARAAAHLAMRRNMAELRRLQTERQIRAEIAPARADHGLAIMKRGKRPETPAQPPAQPAKLASLCKSAFPIPRSRRCPCNSGKKYKRCCGQNAPPVLGKAA